jgi:sugar phosphate isomerase/epimerase
MTNDMTRPIILFSGQWTDLSLEELAPRASGWGYQGLELSCWGGHFEIPAALDQEEYCQAKLDFLAGHDLTVLVLGTHRLGQAVCDTIDLRHREILPEYVWGDGELEGVQKRAAEAIMGAARAAQKMGVPVLSGFTGSSLWASVLGYPAPTSALIDKGFQHFRARWNPILDVCRDCGIRYAFEVHPGQIAFDLYSAEMALDALDGREEFGFTFDPSHLFWQGIDPVEFLRRFPDRIFHVHVKDIALALNGRTGLLGSYLAYGDPRRGWDFRSPGRGGLDWESIIRALNQISYEGPLSVEWGDRNMDRDSAAEEAYRFVRRLDFEPAPRDTGRAFRDS